jgi:hypothetical protein
VRAVDRQVYLIRDKLWRVQTARRKAGVSSPPSADQARSALPEERGPRKRQPSHAKNQRALRSSIAHQRILLETETQMCPCSKKPVRRVRRRRNRRLSLAISSFHFAGQERRCQSGDMLMANAERFSRRAAIKTRFAPDLRCGERTWAGISLTHDCRRR